MSFRDVKNAARLDLHQAMQVEANYYAGGAPAVPITVRVHSKTKALGDLQGTSLTYAEVREDVTRLVFLNSQITPVRGAVVVVAADEGYRVDTVDPKDGITRLAEVVEMTAAELVAFPPPGA